MKRLDEAKETLQAAIDANTDAILNRGEEEQEAAAKELERVQNWFDKVVDDMGRQAREMRHRAERFDVKFEECPFGSNDVVPEVQLLVTHNGTQWSGLSMTADEMQVIRDMLTEKLVQLGVETDPKLSDPARQALKGCNPDGFQNVVEVE